MNPTQIIAGKRDGAVPAAADIAAFIRGYVAGDIPDFQMSALAMAMTASIMSKKAAEGLSALVLDVKFGSGAFMKNKDDARRLAESMVGVGARMGIRTTALLTDMNQPNGRLAGNAVTSLSQILPEQFQLREQS